MRVLGCCILASYAIGAAMVGLGACYNPSIADCQFACGAKGACPDGTTCTDGYCHATSAGACPLGGGDAGPTNDSSIDAPVVACPGDSPCGSTPVHVAADDCAVLCIQQVTFADALGTCGSDTGASEAWHIAIVDTAAKRTAFGEKLPTSVGWIGLQQTALQWHWLNPSNEPQLGSGAPWASGEPSAVHTEGAFDSTSSSDVFRTGAATDTKQFFCEYRP